LNGTSIASGSVGWNTTLEGAGGFVIGNDNGGGHPALPGFVRNMRVWNRVLSGTEISTVIQSDIVNSPNPINTPVPSGLVGEWLLNPYLGSSGYENR
jgi:hypothetical protein